MMWWYASIAESPCLNDESAGCGGSTAKLGLTGVRVSGMRSREREALSVGRSVGRWNRVDLT